MKSFIFKKKNCCRPGENEPTSVAGCEKEETEPFGATQTLLKLISVHPVLKKEAYATPMGTTSHKISKALAYK